MNFYLLMNLSLLLLKVANHQTNLLINNLAQIYFFLISGTCASSGSGGVGITMLHFFLTSNIFSQIMIYLSLENGPTVFLSLSLFFFNSLSYSLGVGVVVLTWEPHFLMAFLISPFFHPLFFLREIRSCTLCFSCHMLPRTLLPAVPQLNLISVNCITH